MIAPAAASAFIAVALLLLHQLFLLAALKHLLAKERKQHAEALRSLGVSFAKALHKIEFRLEQMERGMDICRNCTAAADRPPVISPIPLSSMAIKTIPSPRRQAQNRNSDLRQEAPIVTARKPDSERAGAGKTNKTRSFHVDAKDSTHGSELAILRRNTSPPSQLKSMPSLAQSSAIRTDYSLRSSLPALVPGESTAATTSSLRKRSPPTKNNGPSISSGNRFYCNVIDSSLRAARLAAPPNTPIWTPQQGIRARSSSLPQE